MNYVFQNIFLFFRNFINKIINQRYNKLNTQQNRKNRKQIKSNHIFSPNTFSKYSTMMIQSLQTYSTIKTMFKSFFIIIKWITKSTFITIKIFRIFSFRFKRNSRIYQKYMNFKKILMLKNEL